MLHLIDLLFFHEAFLQIEVIILALSRKSLCLILTKSHFLQFMLCWISNFIPHGQNVGRFVKISRLYRKLNESRNNYSDSSKQCSVIGNIISQFDTPYSALILTSRFCFSLICDINSYKQLLQVFSVIPFVPCLVFWLFFGRWSELHFPCYSVWCYLTVG